MRTSGSRATCSSAISAATAAQRSNITSSTTRAWPISRGMNITASWPPTSKSTGSTRSWISSRSFRCGARPSRFTGGWRSIASAPIAARWSASSAMAACRTTSRGPTSRCLPRRCCRASSFSMPVATSAASGRRPSIVKRMDLSVVIPVKNEAGNIAPLVAEIVRALDGRARYEIIYVDDGSEDATAAEIRRLQASVPRLRLLRHARSCGQSAAIRSAVKAARGGWIATLDGDGQNDPADIPALWRIAQGSPATPPLLIAGHRARRQDSWSKRQASRLANAVRRRVLHDDTPDSGCGLKLFPRALFLDLPYFDHMHRFLSSLVLREGGVVRSVPVNHRPRQRGLSKYGVLDRLGVGIADLAGVLWLRRRLAGPLLVEDAAPLEEAAERPAESSSRKT